MRVRRRLEACSSESVAFYNYGIIINVIHFFLQSDVEATRGQIKRWPTCMSNCVPDSLAQVYVGAARKGGRRASGSQQDSSSSLAPQRARQGKTQRAHSPRTSIACIRFTAPEAAGRIVRAGKMPGKMRIWQAHIYPQHTRRRRVYGNPGEIIMNMLLVYKAFIHP